MLRISLWLAVVAVAVTVAGTGSAATTKLSGVAGPGFTITLKSGGKPVKTLKAGTYTVAVSDKSSAHNFHLFGPGVNKTTSVPFIGSKTWTMKLKPGKYTYQCDVHASVGMKGSFTVTS